MGQSTNAILVWGVDLDLGELEEEVQDRIEHLLDDGWEELERLEKKTGVALVSHCCSEEPMYILGLAATMTVARRGYPEKIVSLDLPKNAQESLTSFAEALGIVVTKKGKKWLGRWLLASERD